MTSLQLIVVEQDGRQQTVPLTLAPGESYLIGRASEADLSLADDWVGLEQCRLIGTNDGVQLVNLDLEWGTMRNGTRIEEPVRVATGDVIEMGGVKIELRIDGAPATAPTTSSTPTPKTSTPSPPKDDPWLPASTTTPAADPWADWDDPQPATPPATPTPTPASTPKPAPPEPEPPRAARPDSARRDAAPPTTAANDDDPTASAPAPEPVSDPWADWDDPAPAPTAPPPAAPKPIAAPTPTPTPEPVAPASPEPAPVAPAEAHAPASPTRVTAPTTAEMSTWPRDPDGLGPYLRDVCPEATTALDDAALRAIVGEALDRAPSLGFTDVGAVRYARLVVMLEDELAGPESKHDAVWFALANQNKPAGDRLDYAERLAQRAVDRRRATPPAPAGAAKPSTTTSPAPAPDEDATPATRPPVPRPTTTTTGAGDGAATDDPSAATHGTHAAPPPEVEAGLDAHDLVARIEDFRLLTQIGSGGMGQVWRAHDLSLQRDVAIKVLRTLRPEFQARLLEEAQAAAQLRHPNIVEVRQFCEVEGVAYCVMELVEGQDLHKLLRSIQPNIGELTTSREVCAALQLDPEQLCPEARAAMQDERPYYPMVAWWMAGIADALRLAHDRGIVHRDIKPSNLLIDRDGRMKIADFGLAARQGVGSAGDSSRVGTPRYLAPERVADWALGTETVAGDGRIDIWGLGVTMYELLTYRRAFIGTEERVLHEIVSGNPPSPRSLVWTVPEALDRICMKAMARAPGERYARADQMGDDLRTWLAGEEDGSGGQKRPWLGFLRRGEP